MSTSQNKMILSYLESKHWFSGSRKVINDNIAREKYGVRRLASRINDLRNQGHDIKTITKKSIKRFGKKCSFAEYKLERAS